MFIPNVSSEGTNVLPPQKAARPNIAFKEMSVEHLTETLWFPSKPEYKPIQITLYDIKVGSFSTHPVLDWFKKCYDARSGQWTLPGQGLMENVRLELYDGCGTTIEAWVFENAWPQQIDFGDLDMGSSELITCDITLRYARSYLSSD
jgi:hypothetical protein